MTNELTNPDYLFEVSWEVCNKVGGIYTVIATKSLYLKRQLHKHHILIGPDVWMDTESNPDFIEDTHLYSLWKAHAASEGIRVRIGKWNVPGNPIAILVDFKQFLYKSVLAGKNDSSRDKHNHDFAALEAVLNKYMTQKSCVPILVVGRHTVFRHH